MARRQSPETVIIGGVFAVIVGIFKGVWWLVSLPWRGKTKKYGRTRATLDKELVVSRWNEIKLLTEQGGESRLRSAVVEADKLLDYALRGKGIPGETMGERLRAGQRSFSRAGYDAAWRGHKLRNRLVHEVDVDVLHFEVKEAVKNFEMALRELGVL